MAENNQKMPEVIREKWGVRVYTMNPSIPDKGEIMGQGRGDHAGPRNSESIFISNRAGARMVMVQKSKSTVPTCRELSKQQ